jgi:hypothetical protein
LNDYPVRSVFEVALNAIDSVLVVCEGEERMARKGWVLE